MRLHALWIILGMLILLVNTARVASAGEEKDGYYHGSLGYKFAIPPEWQRWDLATSQALETELPDNLKGISSSGADVVYYKKDSTFASSISLAIIELSFELPDANRASAVAVDVGHAFQEADTRVSYSKHKMIELKDGSKALQLDWRAKKADVKLRVRQVIVPLKSLTVIVTCTFHAEEYQKSQSYCTEVIETLSLGERLKGEPAE